MRFAKRLALILPVLIWCVGCDQATKSIALSVLSETQVYSFANDTFRLQIAYNPGAFLSVGATLPRVWRQAIFVAGVACLLVGALAFTVLTKKGPPLKIVAVALVCGGGIGNLLDRLFRDGRVLDFINIGLGPVRSGIFNVADLLIVIGALVLTAHVWQRQP